MKNSIIYFTLLAASFSLSTGSIDPILSTGCKSDNDCASQFPDSYCDFDRKVDCDEGVCTCKLNLVPDTSRKACIPRALEIGDNCTHDNECIGSFGELSRCQKNGPNSTCECTDSNVFCVSAALKVKECVRPRENLGEPCSGCNAQCSRIPGAICSYDSAYDDPWRCRCNRNGYVVSEDNTKCIPAPNMLGEKCDAAGTRQCKLIARSICNPKTQTCECNPETHVPSTTGQYCLPLVEHFGMDCYEDGQCMPVDSKCMFDGGSERRCTCNATMVQSNLKADTCIPRRAQDQTCDEDAQCTLGLGPNSECSAFNMTCQCKHGYFHYPSTDTEWGSCFPWTPIGGRCKTPRQCLDATGSEQWTTCQSDWGTEGVCNCTGYDYYAREHDGICYESTSIRGRCRNDIHCKLWITGPALCDNNTNQCVCDDNYEYYSNNRCSLI